MKNFFINESGQYKIRMRIQAGTKLKALGKFEDIVCNETPSYLELEPIDREVEEQEE